MLTPEEKQYLTWLASHHFAGWGSIADLGPWLGSSSAALAEGLKQRGAGGRIYSFDRFQWEASYMEAFAETELRDGDDFLPVFLREVAGYEAWIEPRRADLMEYVWDGGPIEILFVDAAKSWELTNAIFRGFGQHLVPGRSRIVLQDFRYYNTHWLPLIFDSRPDLWKQVEDVDEGHLVTFMPLKPLQGPAGIHLDYSEDAFPFEPAEALLRRRMESEAPANRHWFLKSLYRKFLIDGPLEKSAGIRRDLHEAGVSPADLASIGEVESILVPRGWKAYDSGEFERSRAAAERCLAVSGERSVHALTLLAFSLLRLGDARAARDAIEEVLSRAPEIPSARLLRAEMETAAGRHEEAASEALQVLAKSPEDNTTIQYAVSVLSQIWDVHGTPERHLRDLAGLGTAFDEKPPVLAVLACEQFKAGRRRQARQNVEKALRLAPGHKLALEVRARWIGGGN